MWLPGHAGLMVMVPFCVFIQKEIEVVSSWLLVAGIMMHVLLLWP
jgi:hypothetical protein